MLIDSHCHLNYLEDPDARLDEARAAGVRGFLCIGVERASQDAVLALADRHADVWASAGVHPDGAGSAGTLDWITDFARRKPVVAIGETGLDYFRLDRGDQATRREQREVFDAQLSIACDVGLPIVVHTRAAESDTLSLLRRHAGVTGVLHCFTESWDLARAALDLGFYISISGIVTFRNADNVREVASRVPGDRLLIETDAPWLAPVPHRGETNHPALLPHTARFLAELRDESEQDLHEKTGANFFRLFNRAC